MQKATASEFRLLSDEPWISENDPLEFDDMAEGLAEMIRSSRDSTPFTLGVEAPWGMGKSSLMRRLAGRLGQDPAFKTIWFNAWTAGRDDALEGLIRSVLYELDTNVVRRAMRNANLMRGLGLVAGILSRVLGVHRAVDELWQRIEVDPAARNEVGAFIDQVLEEWRKEIREPDATLVVFIDDLDRCSPGSVFQVFEAVKLYLNNRGFVFVIGFDNQIVSEAIVGRFEHKTRLTGREYIEKIIQVSHRIPRPTETQLMSLISSSLELARAADLLDAEKRELVIQQNGGNLRRIKRFINEFVIRQKLEPGVHPRVTIDALIFHRYFPEFSTLFQHLDYREILDRFKIYADARQVIRRNGWLDDEPALVKAWSTFELGPPASASINELLERLDKAVMPEFPPLAGNPLFVRFVASLLEEQEGGSAQAEELVRQVAKEQAKAGPPASSQAADTVGGRSLRGVRVLWLDDAPEGNRAQIERLEAMGAVVRSVTEREEAEQLLAQGSEFDAFVSDVTRHGKTNAGFEDLESLRSGGLAAPVIFYTGRVTPQRQARAAELDARITSDPGELEAYLSALHGEQRHMLS